MSVSVRGGQKVLVAPFTSSAQEIALADVIHLENEIENRSV